MTYFNKGLNENMYSIASFYTKEEKELIRQRSMEESRNISNYVRSIVLKEIKND